MRWNLANAFLSGILVIICFGETGTVSLSGSAVVKSDDSHSVYREASGGVAEVGRDTEAPPVGNFSVAGNDTEVAITQSRDKQGILGKFLDSIRDNQGVIVRSLIVLASVTGIVLAYLLIRCIRLRGRRSKSKKYGLITMLPDDNLEMRPLDAEDDEDEDMTVFERASQTSNGKAPRRK